MKKVASLILLVIALFIISNRTTYSYWSSNQGPSIGILNMSMAVGSWGIYDELDSFNLNIWEDEDNLNQVVPNNQLFTYDGIIYVSNAKHGYIPEYHGLPGSGGNQWAYFALGLDWIPNVNYRTNSVVIREGRYFIANSAYNDDWFVGDPLNSTNKPWSEWREILPISNSNFSLFEDTGLVDYANPDFDYIFYVT